MTRQTSIPTRQQIDDTVQDVFERFNDTEIDKNFTMIDHVWSVDPKLDVSWCQSVLFADISPNMDDIKSWKKQHNYDDKRRAIICFPKQKEFTNSRDERETGVYYNAYPMYNLERYIDVLPEYIPQELPPLYGLAEYNNINVLYGPNKRGYGGFLRRKVKWIKYEPNTNAFIQLSHDKMETYFHELAHYYDHKVHKFNHSGKVPSEVIAEVTSCVLAMIYGKDITQDSFSYIACHVRKDAPAVRKRCNRVLDRITNVLHSIVDDAEKLADSNTNE